MARDLAVTTANICQSLTAEAAPNGFPQQSSHCHLVLHGDISEPLHGLSRVELRLYVTDAQLVRQRPAAFGVIVPGRSVIRIGAFVQRAHWQDLCTIASAGAVKHCRITFTAPSRGQGFVTRVDFANAYAALE